jgi:mttA/Hcf106 family protein
MPFGTPELIIVFAVALLLFGPGGKKPIEIAEDLAEAFRSIRERGFPPVQLPSRTRRNLALAIAVMLACGIGVSLISSFGFETYTGLVGFLLCVSSVFVLVSRLL